MRRLAVEQGAVPAEGVRSLDRRRFWFPSARQCRIGPNRKTPPVERRKARRVMNTPGVLDIRVRHADVRSANDTVRRPALHSPHFDEGRK